MDVDTRRLPSICYVLPRTGYAGTEKHVLKLAIGLAGRGFKTQILCVFEEGSLADAARIADIPLDCLAKSNPLCHQTQRWHLSTMLQLLGWLRTHPVDILHTYLFGFHAFAGIPARILKTPVVLSSRREIAAWKESRHRWLENLGNLFVDRIICCSKAVESWTRENERIKSKKLVTITNGVDCEFFEPSARSTLSPRWGERERVRGVKGQLGIPAEAAVVGTVANFGAEKDYPTLLEAAGMVLRQMPSAWFVSVGDGPLLEDMKKKAAQGNGADRIVFAGRQQDVRPYLEAMDVFVLASAREGLPNALMEAMAMAKPIVSTNVGGIPEVLRSDREGLLVMPGDSQALAQAILALFRNPSLAQRYGQAARERVEKDFSLARMLDGYEALYRSMRNSSSPLEGEDRGGGGVHR